MQGGAGNVGVQGGRMLGEHRYYVLNDKNEVVQEPDGGRWAEFMGSSDNQRTMWNPISKKVQVMTDFSGVDLDWAAPSPVCFSTVVFCQDEFLPGLLVLHRWSTWEEAVLGHEAAVEFMKALMLRHGIMDADLTDGRAGRSWLMLAVWAVTGIAPWAVTGMVLDAPHVLLLLAQGLLCLLVLGRWRRKKFKEGECGT